VSDFLRSPFCSIYLITNVTNGKRYVGQTWQSIRVRWHKHQAQKVCRKLFNAIQAHGAASFTIELLTLAATQEIANHFEAYFMDRYDSINSGYNIRGAGARGSLSLETKIKMSNARRGKPVSAAARAKQSAVRLGKKLSPETRARISAVQVGRRHTPETRAKMSVAHKGMRHAPEVYAQMGAARKALSPEDRAARGQKMWATRRANQAQRAQQ